MKKKRKNNNVIKIVLVIAILLIIILLVSKLLVPQEEEEVKVVDSISSYGYTLEDRDTELMKNTYNELKTVLNASTIDMEAYATNLTKLFIMDLFTINNKRNKYDVGGTEYVYPEAINNFKLNAEDTLYKTVKTNSDGKRKQELPVVTSVTIDENILKDKFTIGENAEYDSFVIKATWEYEKNLGYDTKATITCIEKEGKIFIVKYQVGE